MIRRVHGTAVHLPGLGGALILGESGAGKSALALNLIQRGGLLIADDQPVELGRPRDVPITNVVAVVVRYAASASCAFRPSWRRGSTPSFF